MGDRRSMKLKCNRSLTSQQGETHDRPASSQRATTHKPETSEQKQIHAYARPTNQKLTIKSALGHGHMITGHGWLGATSIDFKGL